MSNINLLCWKLSPLLFLGSVAMESKSSSSLKQFFLCSGRQLYPLPSLIPPCIPQTSLSRLNQSNLSAFIHKSCFLRYLHFTALLSSGPSTFYPHISKRMVPKSGHITSAEASQILNRADNYLPFLEYDTSVSTSQNGIYLFCNTTTLTTRILFVIHYNPWFFSAILKPRQLFSIFIAVHLIFFLLSRCVTFHSSSLNVVILIQAISPI